MTNFVLIIGVVVLILVFVDYSQGDSTDTNANLIPSALPPGPNGATSASPVDGVLHWFDIAGKDLGAVTNPDGSVFDDSGDSGN